LRLTFLYAVTLAATVGFSHPTRAQQTVTVDPYGATIGTDLKTIAPGKPVTLDVFILDSTSMAPSEKVTVTAALSMPAMAGMTMKQPKVVHDDKPGHYTIALIFPHPGDYKLDLTVTPTTGKATTLSFKITPGSAVPASSTSDMKGMQHTPGMEGMQMKGAFGSSANREGSGTSWQPDSSPMFMKMLPSLGGFDLSTMGTIKAGYVDAGGKRGDKGFFSESMIMLMGRKDLGGGMLGLDFMTSLDPIVNGEEGVPDLFQTGETAHGIPLVDRQHPHNLFSEVAASYSHPLSKDWSGFAYAGPVGEPALGGVMFMHRASGMEIPEAPISHHWFDSTHISFGVATLGLVYQNKWKVEGSLFNGHEPGENRYTIGPEGLNSASGRVSYNPSRDWSFQASYGYLNSPEALSPGDNEHRLTVSAGYNHDLPHGDNISATAYFGQNLTEGNPAPSNAWLIEATYYHLKESFFMRFERVDKDELFNVPPGNYTINKLLIGDVHDFYSKDRIDYGIGVYAGLYSFPASLDPYYGKSPLTYGIFLRIRPSKM
jgi:hypothetical protein